MNVTEKMGGGCDMKTMGYMIVASFALALAGASFPIIAASPAFAEGEPPPPEPEPTKGNNGFGQEKRGIFDGENAGSDDGTGIAGGGEGAGLAGQDSKQDDTALR